MDNRYELAAKIYAAMTFLNAAAADRKARMVPAEGAP